MLASKLIEMLRCPVDGHRLTLLDDQAVLRLNAALQAGELRDRLDQRITSPLEAALLNVGCNRIYPIRGGIPSLVANEAIDLPELFFECN